MCRKRPYLQQRRPSDSLFHPVAEHRRRSSPLWRRPSMTQARERTPRCASDRAGEKARLFPARAGRRSRRADEDRHDEVSVAGRRPRASECALRRLRPRSGQRTCRTACSSPPPRPLAGHVPARAGSARPALLPVVGSRGGLAQEGHSARESSAGRSHAAVFAFPQERLSRVHRPGGRAPSTATPTTSRSSSGPVPRLGPARARGPGLPGRRSARDRVRLIPRARRTRLAAVLPDYPYIVTDTSTSASSSTSPAGST